jgi:hypothetical protein
LFRQGVSSSLSSEWFSKGDNRSQLLLQELYIRDFLFHLLKSRGIFLRACILKRTNQSLVIDLDLYFSYVLTNRSKFFWAKVFFKSLKKKYTTLQKIKDFKSFLSKLELSQEENNSCFLSSSENSFKLFSKNVCTVSDLTLDFKQRFLFFLVLKEKKIFLAKKKKKMSLLCVLKRSYIPKILRIRLPKLNKLFKLNKVRFRYDNFNVIKTFLACNSKSTLDILELNRYLCVSLQKFTGIEKINIRFKSNQLSFLPSLKLYLNFILKELVQFQRNKNLNLFFFETLEILYFVLGTFSKGNAALLANYLSFLLENSRKHVFIVRFLKKALDVFFVKLPSDFLSVGGLKIQIKGRFNKRRRTKTLVLQFGQLSSQTISLPLDYSYTQAVTLYGSFGIKVWLSKKLN